MPKTNNLDARIEAICARASQQLVALIRGEVGDEARRLLPARGRRPSPSPSQSKLAPRRSSVRRHPTGGADEHLELLLDAITAYPNQRAEEIRQHVGLPAEAVKAGLARLRTEGRVKARGKARGTTYAVT